MHFETVQTLYFVIAFAMALYWLMKVIKWFRR